jgi:hypothetical protein
MPVEALDQILTALDQPADSTLVAAEPTPIHTQALGACLDLRDAEPAEVQAECPRCNANAGEPCRTKSGARLHGWHVARRSAPQQLADLLGADHTVTAARDDVRSRAHRLRHEGG